MVTFPIEMFLPGSDISPLEARKQELSYWLQGYSPGVVGRPVELPAAFERLLADAERDLGPR